MMTKADLEHIPQKENESLVFKAQDYPHPLAKWHHHPEYEIHLSQKTSGKAFIGDYIGRYDAGAVFIVGPNLPHNWVSEVKETETIKQRDIVIQFSQALIDKSIAVFPEIKSLNTFFKRSCSGLCFTGTTALKAAELMKKGVKETPLKRLPLLLELFILLAEHPSHDSQVLSKYNNFPAWDEKTTLKINRITQSILTRYIEPLTVAELSDEFSMTQPTFSRFFKKHTGHNVTRYINKLRIGKACQLLIETDKLIATIAFSVGYKSLSHFNKNFFNEMNMTAREYRKAQGLK